jgi:hypothetical protein
MAVLQPLFYQLVTTRLRLIAAVLGLGQQLSTRQRHALSLARRLGGQRGKPYGAVLLVDCRADRLERLPCRLHGHHVTRDVQADVSARPVVGKGHGAIREPFGHVAIGVVPVPDRAAAADTRDVLQGLAFGPPVRAKDGSSPRGTVSRRSPLGVFRCGGFAAAEAHHAKEPPSAATPSPKVICVRNRLRAMPSVIAPPPHRFTRDDGARPPTGASSAVVPTEASATSRSTDPPQGVGMHGPPTGRGRQTSSKCRCPS